MPDLGKTVDTYAKYIDRLEKDNDYLKEQLKKARVEIEKLKNPENPPETPEETEEEL